MAPYGTIPTSYAWRRVGHAPEMVGDNKLSGIVRFSGTTKFAEGEWLGIEHLSRSGGLVQGWWIGGC